MSEKTLRYRAQFDILKRDEQMSILVQRVSGDFNRRLFYPLMGGVAYSYNPYVWNKDIKPEDGVIRIVFGMGTRAVDRTDDDYTRIVALNSPDMRPEENSEKVKKYSQKKVDVIDLEANRLVSMNFEDVVNNSLEVPLDFVASRDIDIERYADEHDLKNVFSWVITFDGLFQKTDFIECIKDMLKIIHKAYNYYVDVEFTVNYVDVNRYKINIVQCRPFQFKGGDPIEDFNKKLETNSIIIMNKGPVIGQSRDEEVERIVYIVPSLYGNLTMNEKYSVARLIGKINNLQKNKKLLMLGPGRWGTSTPSLGIPVSINEINKVSYLCEIVAMRDNLTPDISLGTHFFNDLVELDILYFALYPDKEETILNVDFLENTSNHLVEVLPEAAKFSEVVRVIDIKKVHNAGSLFIYANCMKQQVICYLKNHK
jgi:hypothetical protein